MKFKAVISFESDFKPVRTYREEFNSTGPKPAMRQAARIAVKNWPEREQFRSWVICLEKCEE